VGWVLIVHDNGNMSGWYVAQDGSPCSYTPDIRKAKRFDSRSHALNQACGNEQAVSVESQLSPY
jgi:hypothetical protein